MGTLSQQADKAGDQGCLHRCPASLGILRADFDSAQNPQSDLRGGIKGVAGDLRSFDILVCGSEQAILYKN